MTDTLSPPRAALRPLELDGASLTIDDVLEVARRRRRVALAGSAAAAVADNRALKLSLVESGIPIYGVTTGFGDSAHRQISAGKADGLQQNMLRFLGCGTGPIAPAEVTRATMLLRANCLARGYSGVRLELVERLLALLEADALPRIPERGSCGASGDLVPLSYVGRALTGETDLAYGGSVRPAAEVLSELGLAPLELESKEGLALTNGTSFMTAFACLAVGAARELADLADLLTAMTSESVLGNRAHFNSFLFDAAKPHRGMSQSAANIRRVLAGSELAIDAEAVAPSRIGERGFLQLDRHVQDRYSIRCAPHVIGVLRDVIAWVQEWVGTEINSSDDNPLFDPYEARAQSGGNFYGGHIGQAMDSLKVALANLCDLLDRQLELIVDEKFSGGLTPNLIARLSPEDPQAGLHHGFKGMQLCCSAMTAEAMKLCNPATIHSRSTECHNQDKVSMGSIAARDARSIVELVQNVAAVHLIALCQALELRGLERVSPIARQVVGQVRERVPFVAADRCLDGDIAQVVSLVEDGTLTAGL